MRTPKTNFTITRTLKPKTVKIPYFKGNCKVCGEKVTVMYKQDKCPICEYSYEIAYRLKCEELAKVKKDLYNAKQSLKKYKDIYVSNKRQAVAENWNFHAYSSER